MHGNSFDILKFYKKLKDLENNLYESFYLNFTGSISRDLLEELAQRSIQSKSSLKIAKVFYFIN